MSKGGDVIDWRTISEGDFNRLAESLIRRSVDDGSPGIEVKAVDGRGGDGGIDLDARVRKTQQLITIYQLKWFPEEFSGGFARARKPQIRRSFESALAHDPEVWYLVVPRNLTPKERSFLRSLQGKRRSPRVRYLGAGELDDLLQKYPDLDEWAQRTPTRIALKEVGRQSAALVKPDDLHAEVARISTKLRARSDYWDWNFSRHGDDHRYTLVPRRDDAAEREPLSINVTANFTDDPELGAAYQAALDYGPTEPVKIPGQYVTQFEHVGPEWWAEVPELHSFELHPAPRKVDIASRLVLRDDDGRIIAQRTARSVQVTSGNRGGNLLLDLGDGIQLTMTLDKDRPESASLNFSMKLDGQTGSAALRALQFQQAFANAATVEHHLGKGSSLSELTTRPKPPEVAYLEFVDDLALIERETGVAILVPEYMPTPLDRINARVARRVLSGEVVLMPKVDGMTMTLSGEVDPTIEQILTTGGHISITEPGWDIDVFGQTITLPDVGLLLLNVSAENGAEHLAALEAGNGAGRVVQFVPQGPATGLRVYAKERVDPDAPLVPTRWNLTGINEHKELQGAGLE